MTGLTGWAVVRTVGWAALAEFVVLAATFALARRVGKHSVIDTAWGVLFVAIAIAAFAGSTGRGEHTRRILLLVLVLIWGLRLAQHIGRRTVGAPEDARYAQLLARASGSRQLYALRVVYATQGALALLIAAPIWLGDLEPGSVGVIGWVGVAVWAVGVFFEAVGDAQLERFRADVAHRGRIIDTGLWRYTRHPNYFGDACVWWGIFLVAAERWPGVLTIAAPVVMTALLTRGSGVRILERHMSSRAGWAEYAQRTSAFIPWRPRRVER